MDPADYQFVRNGPDCKWCHHTRADHVGWNKRYETRDYDLPCQVVGCGNCRSDGYRPLGPLNYLVLCMHDQLEREAIVFAEREAGRRLRPLLLSALWGALVSMFVANVASHAAGSTALAVPFVVLALCLLTVYGVGAWQTVHGSSRLLATIVVLPVPILVLSTAQAFVRVSPAWLWIVTFGLISLGLILFGIELWRSRRVMKRIHNDLELVQWEPLFAVSVRFGEPDTDEPQTSD